VTPAAPTSHNEATSPSVTQPSQNLQSGESLTIRHIDKPSLQTEVGDAVDSTQIDQLDDGLQDSEGDMITMPLSSPISTSSPPLSITAPAIPSIPASTIISDSKTPTLSEPSTSAQSLLKNVKSSLIKSKQVKKVNDGIPTPTVNERPLRQAAASSWKDGPARFRHTAYCITVNAALKDDTKHDSAVQAIKDEIVSMVNGDVMTPISCNQISPSERRNIILTHMFLKGKNRSDGQYDKMKRRLVDNGNFESPDHIEDTYAPTANPISVLTVLNIAAANGSLISSYDINSAFLQTPIPESEKLIHVKVPSSIAKFWVNWYPNYKKQLHSDGSLYFKLNRYLYGLCEAPNRFNNMLHHKLVDMEFKRSKAVNSLYVSQTPNGRLTVAVHVDDILLTSTSRELQKLFESKLQSQFEITTLHDNISYIGLYISQVENELLITQSKHKQDLVSKYKFTNISKYPKTPAGPDLFTTDTTSGTIDKSAYLSLLMSLMYIGRYFDVNLLSCDQELRPFG